MKKLDDLAKRMKDYELRSRSYIPRRGYTVIRIDGKAFHTYTKGLEKPFDFNLMEDMAEVTKYICSKIQGAKFGYTQSDEISIILTDYDTIHTDAWFDGQVQKMCSIAASLAASKFNQLRTCRALSSVTGSYDEVGETGMFQLFYSAVEDMTLADFDARVFSLPTADEVVNYIIWRQQDASRNSVSMAAQANFSHSKLQGASTSVMQDMLMLEKGINWNDYPVPCKRGWFIRRQEQVWCRASNNKDFKPYVMKENEIPAKDGIIYTRNGWIIDNEMPIITKDKTYIIRILPDRK